MSRKEFSYFVEEYVPLSFVVGHFQELRICAGGRQFIGKSPLTREKTPSFHIDDATSCFWDFSSGVRGKSMAYLIRCQKMTGREAAAFLVEKAELHFIPERYRRVRKKRRRTRRRGI